jgi:type II secretory pathway component PulM
MTGLLDWFRGLSGRERRLVVVAAVLGLAVVLVEGVGVPLAGLWQDARADHDARLAQAARLVRQLDELGPPRAGALRRWPGWWRKAPGPGW